MLHEMESMYLESLNDYKATSNDGKFFVKTLGKIFENFQNKFENILVFKLYELRTQGNFHIQEIQTPPSPEIFFTKLF